MNKLTLDVDKLRVETFPISQGEVPSSLEAGTLTICCSGSPTCGTCPPP